MSLPPNIERFNIITAKTFAMLYQSFPVPRDLLMGPDFDIPHIMEISHDFENNYVSEREDILFVQSTIYWLHDAGYIEAKNYTYPFGFREVLLTAKGLETLKAIPPSLSTDKNAGELVLDAVKSGASDSMSDAVKFILSKGVELLPYAVKAMS